MARDAAAIAKRKADRKAFVASRGSEKDSESRKRFYVQTRVAELEKKTGKPVSAEKRKQLRQKFLSGDVEREGFAAPKKKVNKPDSNSTPTPATSNMKGVSGFKAGSSTKSSRQFGPQLSAAQKADRQKAFDKKKNEKKKGRSGLWGKIQDGNDWVYDNIGLDDAERATKYTKNGEYLKALKSGATSILELGQLAAIIGSGGAAGAASGAGRMALGTGAKQVIKGTVVRVVPKAIGTGPKALGTGVVKSVAGSVAKSAAKSASKSVSKSVAKRTPKVAKSISKPLNKSVSKSLTSKAVVKSAKKPLASKSVSRSSAAKAKAVAGRAGRNAEIRAVRRGEDGMQFGKIKTSRTGVRSHNHSKSTGKPFTAKQNAALKKNYRATTKEANAARKRAANAKYMTGTSK